MALTTRVPNNTFNNPGGSTRQQIPPFISKLYRMVDDSSSDFLIRWCDAGDSFYVYDHERFAKEVLFHWFKHGHFGAFVRKLNDFGFQRVSHLQLQQGVLESDGGNTEVSRFENRHFQRGRADLLNLIQRKKRGLNEAAADSEAGASLTEIKDQTASSSLQNGRQRRIGAYAYHL